MVAVSPTFEAVLAAVSMFALPRAFALVHFDMKFVGLFMDDAVLETKGEQYC